MMEDKENNAPGRRIQPKITQKYNSVKRKLNRAEEENKRLKTELTESNAKVEFIQNSEFFKELTETGKNLSPPIHDVLKGLAAPVLRENAPENPVGLAIFQGRTNPLEMDVVLHEVFNYLDGNDLATCRLVNSIWKSNVDYRFKGTHKPILLRNSRTIAQFVQRMRDTNEFPYSSFLIKNEFGPRFATQFQKFGGHVKVLQLVGRKFGLRGLGHADMTLSNVLNILRFTPNLETLELSGLGFVDGFIQAGQFNQLEMRSLKHLTLRTDYDGFLSEQAPNAQQNAQAVSLSLGRIFSAAPELTSLKLQVFGRRLLSILLPIVAQVNTLQKLEFESCLTEAHLESLARGVLRLTSVKVVVHLVDCQLLREFLVSQASTLRSLELHVSSFNNRAIQPVTFPVFPNLSHLKLISGFDNHLKAPFQRQTTGNEFPVLQDLWATSDVLSHYFLTQLPFSGVKSLTCEYIRKPNWARIYTYTDLSGVQQSFPNVKEIHIKSPKEHGMKCILKNTASFLEHLVIDFFTGDQTHIDALLTGTPTSSSWLTEQFERLNETPVLIRRIITNFYCDAPNVAIHAMTKLKRLEIRCSDDVRYKLTDVSGYIALLSLHPLEYLAIYNSKLSETCIEELRKVHKTVIIKTLSKEEQKAYRGAHEYH